MQSSRVYPRLFAGISQFMATDGHYKIANSAFLSDFKSTTSSTNQNLVGQYQNSLI
jgi:hypothetical protein